VDGMPYTVERDTRIHDLPVWLADLLEARREERCVVSVRGRS
jgi:hypothetical protein